MLLAAHRLNQVLKAGVTAQMRHQTTAMTISVYLATHSKSYKERN